MTEEKEKMVPWSVAARLFTTGMEWEAGLFVETYKELLTRMSQEEARDIMGKAMYRAGFKLGEEAREFSKTKKGPVGMAEAWDVLYGMGTKEAAVLNDDQFVFRVPACGVFNLMKRWGLSDEDIRFVGRAFCAGDVGQANGFDPDMAFQHTRRLMAGDDGCEWDYSTCEQEKSESAAATAEELGIKG